MKLRVALALTLMCISQTEAHAQPAGRYATVNGIQMYYELRGAGEPLVLIHGGGSTIESSFGRLMPILARTHRVIAVELQAHGRTSDRAAPESFEQDADDVAGLLAQLKIPKAHLLGFSNGGSTALQVAIRHPERVNRIIAVSAIYKRDGMQPGFWPSMEKATFKDMPQGLKDAFLRVNPDSAKLRVMYNKDRQRMLSFTDWNVRSIQSIAAPVLVVVGDKDVVRVEHAVEMARQLPHARLAILPGGHGDILGETLSSQPTSTLPALFAAMMEEFLSARPI